MSVGEEFIRRQDDELKELERDYRRKAMALFTAWKEHAPDDMQTALLLEMHQAGTEYFRRLEAEVFNRDSLTGADYERWKGEWTGTTTKNLHELPRYYRNLRENRERLGLRETMFEPPNGAYYNIQRFFAAACPKEVSALREDLRAANLPTTGFDKPYLPKPHFDFGFMRPFIWVGVVVVLVAAFVIAAQFVHPVVPGGTLSVVVALLVVISAIELLREGKLKEKSFTEIAKLALAKRFQFVLGQKDDPEAKKGRKSKR